MIFGRIACAFGRHRVDRKRIRKVHGQAVGRCRSCRKPLEEQLPNEWVEILVHESGLGARRLH